MIAVKNTIFYHRESQVRKLTDLAYKGIIKQSEIEVKNYRSGDVFHIPDVLVPCEEESILIFEGMTIQTVNARLDQTILVFDFEVWRQRKNSRLFIENMRWRKKTLHTDKKPLF